MATKLSELPTGQAISKLIDETVTASRTAASTNTVIPVLTLNRQSSGTPGAGIGGSLAFNVLTAAGNTETGATIEAVTTDVTSTSEDFDLVFKTMRAGAAAEEGARLTHNATANEHKFLVNNNSGSGAPGYSFAVEATTGIGRNGSVGGMDLINGGVPVAQVRSAGVLVKSDKYLGFASGAVTTSLAAGASLATSNIVQFHGATPTTTAGGVRVMADANGSYIQSVSITEALTLNTGATTTVTAGNLGPANARIIAVLYRVTTAITTAANFNIKVTGGNAFANIGTATTSQTGMTAGTTGVLVPAAFADQYNTSATTLTVTTDANPGAGAIRLTVVYQQLNPPDS